LEKEGENPHGEEKGQRWPRKTFKTSKGGAGNRKRKEEKDLEKLTITSESLYMGKRKLRGEGNVSRVFAKKLGNRRFLFNSQKEKRGGG